LQDGLRELERFTKLSFGEDQRALELSRESLERTDGWSRVLDDPENRAVLNLRKRRALSDLAVAALRLKRWSDAEAAARELLALPRLNSESSERRSLAEPDDPDWPAVILAKSRLGQGQAADALKTIEPALAHYSEARAAGATHLTFRQHHARALYVSASAQPIGAEGQSKRRELLDQAMGSLQALPEEAQQLHDSKELFNWINAARKEAQFGEGEVE
jgi:hypothetical protein